MTRSTSALIVQKPDGSIESAGGEVLHFSRTRFVEDIVRNGHCFMCGADPATTAFNGEHVIPDWILREFNLHDRRITLPNGQVDSLWTVEGFRGVRRRRSRVQPRGISCRETESNGHVACATTDFKSVASTSSAIPASSLEVLPRRAGDRAYRPEHVALRDMWWTRLCSRAWPTCEVGRPAALGSSCKATLARWGRSFHRWRDERT